MNGSNSFSAALNAAVRRVLRPLVRLLLRHSVPFEAFAELAKQVYVDVALTDFALQDKKPSASRASILTGLNRKEVARLMALPPAAGAETAERYNRAARVLTAWTRDTEFVVAEGQPRGLELDGPSGFAALVKRHSGDMPVRAVLDELLRVGAVSRADDGRIAMVSRGFVPQNSDVDKIGILGTDVADLIDTIDHNLQHGASDPRFQRKVMYHSMDASVLPAFRKLSGAQGQALLEKLDHWLAERDVAPPAAAGTRARVGMGIYYFEEPLPAALAGTGGDRT